MPGGAPPGHESLFSEETGGRARSRDNDHGDRTEVYTEIK